MKPFEYEPLSALDLSKYEALVELGSTIRNSAHLLHEAVVELFTMVKALEEREQILLARLAALGVVEKDGHLC